MLRPIQAKDCIIIELPTKRLCWKRVVMLKISLGAGGCRTAILLCAVESNEGVRKCRTSTEAWALVLAFR